MIKRWYEDRNWIVVTENKTRRFCLYDSIGMNSFIKQGFKCGKVFINDEEVFLKDFI